ncbi:general transcription factor IIF subunit 2-like [Diadema setosum]|uniref:general transcription factor IIF subunit 2-like n=1 Tax=Diadema antillarum TaxID=105358 RepID=UPI003A83535A
MASKLDLDLKASSRPIWLVKVPKYVAQRWEKSEKGGHIGKIRIGKKFGKPDISLMMDSSLAKVKLKPEDPEIPEEHKFQVMSAAPGTMMVYSQGSGDKLAIEGKVVERLECRPVRNETYMEMKRKQIELAHKPSKVTKHLDKRPVVAYKPIARHKEIVEYEKKKKEMGKKPRMEKEKVMDILFSAFEKHQYYQLKDLSKITEQPVPYLKEILSEIGTYHQRAPHKYMWELKPEYRHYKTQDEEMDMS